MAHFDADVVDLSDWNRQRDFDAEGGISTDEPDPVAGGPEGADVPVVGVCPAPADPVDDQGLVHGSRFHGPAAGAIGAATESRAGKPRCLLRRAARAGR